MKSAASTTAFELDLPPTDRKSQPRYLLASLPLTDPAWARAEHWHVMLRDRLAPCQVRPLGLRPDRMPRWLLVETIVAGDGQATLKAAERHAPMMHSAHVEMTDTSLTLDNGLVRVDVGRKTDRLIEGIAYAGSPVLADAALRVLTRSGGFNLSERVESAKQRVIATGPVRAGVEISGQHVGADGRPGLAFRLRVELLAGLPVVLMRYWFFHLLPNVQSLSIDELSLELPIAGATGERAFTQSQHGLECVPREVQTQHSVDARVGHDGAGVLRLADPAPLNDTTTYPPYLMPPQDRIEPWLAARSRSAWCVLSVDDLVPMLPKGIRADDTGLHLDLWPAWAAALQLPQGRSRSMTLRLGLFEPRPAPPTRSDVEATISATRCDEPILLEPSAYARADVFEQQHLLPARAEGARRFDDYLRCIACPPTVCDFFDLGDTIDPGYSRTYLQTGRRLRRIDGDESSAPVQFLTNGYAAEWCDLSQYEKVWANNEYDVIWCMGSEMLRSRRPDLFRSLRWFSRHAIEVDFVHFSDHAVKHRSTPPHCARHTTAGTYPSHLWTQGLLQYYAISGDEDALEFARALGDKIIEIFADPRQRAKLWNPTRELGWALLATAALAEMDPQDKYLAISREIADALIATGIDDALVQSAVRYSFGYASIVLGLDKWHDCCGERKYTDWVVRLARGCGRYMLDESGVQGSMSLYILHAGYKHSGDVELLRHGMRTVERLMDSRAWYDPPMYTKPSAMLYRPLSRFFNDAASAGLLKPLDYRYY